MKIVTLLFIVCCHHVFAQNSSLKIPEEIETYMLEHRDNLEESESIGTVSSGSLKHGRLVPFQGNNFRYFDTESYLEGRAFVHSSIRDIVLATYDSLYFKHPDRFFTIMECSNHQGGEMFPHRTHQNGLSIDFMMPLLKDNKPYYGLDTLGASHYFLTFDEEGRYVEDKSIRIDFDMVSKHIVWLNREARKRNYEIKKVIIQIELKEELYAAEYGPQITGDDIYVVRNLSPVINALHDDHYHIDFGPI